ncbi:MAG: YabP/YqfC family sporulation protein [Clostridia bacterium]|nr:YabP/YqfC family sporulation protein [Clostridia bacterium]
MARRYTKLPFPGRADPCKGTGERITDALCAAPVCGRLSCPITLWGNRRIIIEDAREIMHIDENMISVGCTSGSVSITGNRLILCSAAEDCVIVTGEIGSVEFENEN